MNRLLCMYYIIIMNMITNVCIVLVYSLYYNMIIVDKLLYIPIPE